MDWDSLAKNAGELIGALPSWDDVSGAAGSAWDTVSGWAGDVAPYAGEMMVPGGFGDFAPSDFLPSFDPGMAGELIGPGGLLPSDFLPSFDPGMAGELIGPGGLLPSDFLPSFDPGMAGELIGPGGLLPSDFLPSFDPGMAGELMPAIGEFLPSLPSFDDIPWDMAGELLGAF